MNITKGDWRADDVEIEQMSFKGPYVKVNAGGALMIFDGLVAVVGGLDEKQARANANLIAEAGNIANETGFTPRQLADQKAELLEACKVLSKHLDNVMSINLCIGISDTSRCKHFSEDMDIWECGKCKISRDLISASKLIAKVKEK